MKQNKKDGQSNGLTTVKFIIIVLILASFVAIPLRLAYLITPQWHYIGLDGGGEFEWWESPLEKEMRKSKSHP